MKIHYNESIRLIRIDSIFVKDIQGNNYPIENFCGAQQFYFWDNAQEPLCQSSQFILNDNNDKYEMEYIELNKVWGKVTILYISFINDILLYPNVLTPGIVSPEEIKTFGIKLINNNPTKTIINIKLFWNLYIYLCTIYPSINTDEYICNSSIYYKEKTYNDEIYYGVEIENYNHTSMLIIDYIFIQDYSDIDKIYIIDSFCVNSSFNPSFIQNQSNGNCDSMYSFKDGMNSANLRKINEFCIGMASYCGSSHVAIQFSIQLFYEIGELQSGLIYPIDSMIEISTISPTEISTISQTEISTISPTKISTISPSQIPTESPIKQGVIMESTLTTTSIIEPVSIVRNESQNYLWLLIVIGLTIIVTLSFVLILCWLHIKRLKKQHANTVGNLDLPKGNVPMGSLDSTASNVGMMMVEITNFEEGDDAKQDEYHHRNTNQGKEGDDGKVTHQTFNTPIDNKNALKAISQLSQDQIVIDDDDDQIMTKTLK